MKVWVLNYAKEIKKSYCRTDRFENIMKNKTLCGSNASLRIHTLEVNQTYSGPTFPFTKSLLISPFDKVYTDFLEELKSKSRIILNKNFYD